jgi:hypothetical protein
MVSYETRVASAHALGIDKMHYLDLHCAIVAILAAIVAILAGQWLNLICVCPLGHL